MSSGLGGVFPSGYPVGRVTEVTLRPEQAFAEVLAEPASTLDRDREVLLLWDSTEAAPQAAEPQASEPTPDASVAGLH
jgi:rod shape-determining protein MreC